MNQVQLLSWTQSEDNPSVDLCVSIQLNPAIAGAKYKVTVDGKNLTISVQSSSGGGSTVLATWVLFDIVSNDVTWETRDSCETLVINVNKLSMDTWKSCLRTPLSEIFAGRASTEDLNRMLGHEIQALVEAETSNVQREAVTEEDADAILEDVLKTSNTDEDENDGSASLDGSAVAQREWTLMQSELDEIRLRHESEVKAEVSARERGDEAAMALAKKKVLLLEKMLALGTEILELRKQSPTLQNMICVLQKDIAKAKLNRGEEELETEDFADTTEQEMSPEALFVQGLRLLDARKGLEGLHYLRLAAIRYHHPQAVMTLVRIYMEAGEQPKSFHLLVSKALLGGEPPNSVHVSGEEEPASRLTIEPLVNFTTAQMFDNGVHIFRPLMALAVYFYQRAACMGEPTAMTFLGQLYLRGGCLVAQPKPPLVDIRRGLAWIQEGLARGSLLAYKTMLELHLDGQHVTPSYDTAKKLYMNLYESSREYLRQIPDVESRLESLKKGRTGTGVNRRTPPNADDEDAIEELHPSTRITHGAARLSEGGVPGGVSSNAAQRFARMEQDSSRARSGAGVVHATENSGALRTLTARGVAASEQQKRAIFRMACVGVTSSFLYTLAFPLRVLALPYFYATVENLLSLFRRRGAASSSSFVGAPSLLGN